MRFIVVILLSIFIPTKALFSQPSSANVSVKVNWFSDNSSISGKAINTGSLFEGIYYPTNDPTPHLFYKTPSPFGYKPENISVVFDQTKVTIDENISNTFDSKTTFKSEFVGNAYISTEDGVQYLCISLLPFRQGANGVEKLLSAELKIAASGRASVFEKNISSSRRSNSVLADGLWKKIKISNSGVYRLTYEDLIGMGFPDPSIVTIWGSQDVMLNKIPSLEYPVDIQQIPTSFILGSDNRFNNGDMVVFFLKGATEWKVNASNRFNHQIHDFSDFAYYFITNSKPITSTITPATKFTTANTFSSSFDDYTYIEREDTNLIKSGRVWFGESFDILNSRTYTFPIADLNANTPIWARMRTAARSSSSSNFTLSCSGNTVLSTNHIGITNQSETSPAANISESSATFIPTSSSLNLTISYSRPSPSAAGWLDFLELNFRRNLNISTPFMLFRDPVVVGTGNITEFAITGATTESQLWEITSIWDVKQVETTLNSSTLKGIVNTSNLKEYVVSTCFTSQIEVISHS